MTTRKIRKQESTNSSNRKFNGFEPNYDLLQTLCGKHRACNELKYKLCINRHIKPRKSSLPKNGPFRRRIPFIDIPVLTESDIFYHCGFEKGNYLIKKYFKPFYDVQAENVLNNNTPGRNLRKKMKEYVNSDGPPLKKHKIDIKHKSEEITTHFKNLLSAIEDGPAADELPGQSKYLKECCNKLNHWFKPILGDHN